VSRWRVLVVEQDQEVARLHCRQLARQPGFEVVGVAPSARRAVSMLGPQRPHLLVLDLELPGGDGLELLRGLRASGAPVEVIVVTATADAEVVQAAVQLGVVDYLVKPFRPDRLRQALALFVRRAATATPGTRLVQEEIDVLTAVRSAGRRWLPRDLQPERLEQVRCVLAAGKAFTATEIGVAIGVTRTTARRYLEYLVTVGEATVEEVPDGPGRPSKTYAAIDLIGAVPVATALAS